MPQARSPNSSVRRSRIINAGALAEAERRYRYILAQVPAHADSLHNLGLIALNSGNAAAAVDLIGKAIAADNRRAEYHYNIALAWRALGRPDQVAAHLERAIALRGDYVLAHLNLGSAAASKQARGSRRLL